MSYVYRVSSVSRLCPAELCYEHYLNGPRHDFHSGTNGASPGCRAHRAHPLLQKTRARSSTHMRALAYTRQLSCIEHIGLHDRRPRSRAADNKAESDLIVYLLRCGAPLIVKEIRLRVLSSRIAR